ncbi:Transcriptional regulatory protein ros [Methylobacterium crusticola]|uniref:Transcriptional regulatory protein ros n=1 Tax=Methylobacterium crusticola TaxID=1697972 RepID=A0ABQ4R0J1_9HYPH|nr:MucR family transcriptional regulator [Methylobacterium crusticola]GJD51118.1 Transcriptional regulatory protein ros [Methylobacterium crusticola]
MSQTDSLPVPVLRAAEIVTAYVSHNALPITGLPDLIAGVHAAITRLAEPASPAEPAHPVPPVPIRKTVTDDHIISLEDGKPYKSLKRHLGRLGLTPETYRAKWGLPPDYPMTAPSYSAARSAIARQTGLGLTRKAA